MEYIKIKSGITLISLVITIILLLLIAGISIQTLKNTNLFESANNAKKQSEISQIKEEIKLEIYAKQAESTGEITESELKSILEKYGTINYEEDKTTIKGITTPKGYEISISDIYTGGLAKEKLVADGTWQNYKKVNSPELLTGMTPIKFIEPTETEEGTTEKTTYTDEDWYNYTEDKKRWANVQTEDGSMWVWIPRYAYRINSSTQTCDIVFLIGTTDNYYDENGKLQKAKRQTKKEETIDTTTGYTVHPAFTNESNIGFANGGWDKELAGIWVAKFEAGYAGGNNQAESKASSVNYTQSDAWVNGKELNSSDAMAEARNWKDGIYGNKTTSIKYPTFQGLTYSINYINHNDAFNISKVLTETGNIYGLNKNTTDSHLMKNSEWGAVAYLSQSQYGLNGTNIYINNANLNNSTNTIYAVTGCAGITEDALPIETTIEKLNNRTETNEFVWTQKQGTRASSTGTIYGIYDLSGGISEKTANLIYNGHSRLEKYAKSLLNNGENTKYVTIYPYDADNDNSNLDLSSNYNYIKNNKIYGDAIRETSTSGTKNTAWYLDYSFYPSFSFPTFARGVNLWTHSVSGLFSFARNDVLSIYNCGFRSVLVHI